MIKKMNSEEAKSFYKKRGSEIEPIFGILKQAKNFHPATQEVELGREG